MISFLINLNPEDMLLLLHAAILALTFLLMILGGAEFVLTNLCMRQVNRMLRRMMKP